ncbi:hypothetical protein F2P81_025269 [Scophthalmus maximus]|uniref:Uncharacterized protein n=1 Tax=Scophthalmus maximus TaxID=52904 RepID=A0A6A4RJ01_SCOMX|nr:hypothetical protein F2P81_025269 [Scophthalmus maximus]
MHSSCTQTGKQDCPAIVLHLAYCGTAGCDGPGPKDIKTNVSEQRIQECTELYKQGTARLNEACNFVSVQKAVEASSSAFCTLLVLRFMALL